MTQPIPKEQVEVPEEALKSAVAVWQEGDGDDLDSQLDLCLQAAAPSIRAQERERVKEALREQANEYQREADEARERGEEDGWKKLSTAHSVVTCVIDIVFYREPTDV